MILDCSPVTELAFSEAAWTSLAWVMLQRSSESIYRLQQHRVGPGRSRRVTRNALAGVAARDGEFALEGDGERQAAQATSARRTPPLTTNDAPGTARHLAALDRSGLESCNR